MSSISKQLSLGLQDNGFNQYLKQSACRSHGGDFSLGKRKTKRPFDSRKPMHIVLRSDRAKGEWSLRHRLIRKKVDGLVENWAKKTGVRLYTYANGGNHLHMQVRAKHRGDLQKFLRVVPALIARFVTDAQRGRKKGRFWSGLTFTRIADWGKSFKTVRDYVVQNVLEAAGLVAYRPRPSRYSSG